MTTERPLLLDLFCGAGGAAMGYHLAGFEVVGVDIEPQPRYPFEFHLGDFRTVGAALHTSGRGFVATHASPPCQAHSSLRSLQGGHTTGWMIEATRRMLDTIGLPYVIENVPGAPLVCPVTLCGSMFGLGAVCQDGVRRQLRRHRLFEAGFLPVQPECRHAGTSVGVYGNGGGGVARRGREYNGRAAERREAMGIDWMRRAELAQAIPPVYTRWVGAQLRARVRGLR